MRLWVWITSLFLLLGRMDVAAQSLLHLQFDIVGIRLEVSPSALTVPKDIAALQAETAVVAELRGPSSPPVTLTAPPGQPILLPPLALSGDYFLDQIRPVQHGQTLLDATPNVVPIEVISQVLVTSVTSRPLSLEEVQQKGIIIDDKNFQVTNF